MKIKGTMTHVPLSGGFWGILAGDGKRYRPVGPLEGTFQQEGLAVEAQVEPNAGFSIFMWGTDVQVISIHPASK